LFWLSLVALIVMTKLGWATKSDDKAMAAYLFMWGLFTLVMFIGTLRLEPRAPIRFLSLTVLFFLLAYGDFATQVPGSNISPVGEESSAASPRSTPASRKS